MEPQSPLSLFNSRIYDLLENRHKLEPGRVIGTLSREDSALCTAIGLVAERFQEETAVEVAEASFDGIGLTLLTVYEQGLPHGAKMTSAALQRVAEILSKAGEDGRAKQSPEDRGDDDERGAAPDLATAQSDGN